MAGWTVLARLVRMLLSKDQAVGGMGRRTLYDRPVRELLAEAVSALTPPYKPRDFVRWFQANYPRVNDKTVRAHIRAATVNDPNRFHYSMRVGDLLYRRTDGFLDRYDPANPPEDAGDWAEQPLPEELPGALRQAGVLRITGNTELMRRRNYDIVKRVLLDGQTYEHVAAVHGVKPRRAARIVALARGAASKYQLAGSVYYDEGARGAIVELGGPEPSEAEKRTNAALKAWETRRLKANGKQAAESHLEEESLAAASKHFEMALGPAVLSLSGGVTQSFDLVSEDESVVGMLLTARPRRSPESVLASVSERVWLLERLEPTPSVRFILSSDPELLAIWLSHYGRVAEDIEFYVLRDGRLKDARGDR
jgi:hypothetical protein